MSFTYFAIEALGIVLIGLVVILVIEMVKKKVEGSQK